MGEYADYILNGDDCQECGEYIGPGDGFPRSCGGCSQPVKRNSSDDFLALKSVEDFDKLQLFLQNRSFNFVHSDRKDKKGQPMIGLMFTVPKQKGQRRGLIVCATRELQLAALKIVNDYKIGGNIK